MKIVINTCFGGFGLSPVATIHYNKLRGRPCYLFHQPNGFTSPYEPWNGTGHLPLGLYSAFDTQDVPWPVPDKWYEQHNVSVSSYDAERNDPLLVQTVEELGAAASGLYADLSVVEIPDDVEWEIEDYDGSETIHEKHRSWS